MVSNEQLEIEIGSQPIGILTIVDAIDYIIIVKRNVFDELFVIEYKQIDNLVEAFESFVVVFDDCDEIVIQFDENVAIVVVIVAFFEFSLETFDKMFEIYDCFHQQVIETFLKSSHTNSISFEFVSDPIE